MREQAFGPRAGTRINMAATENSIALQPRSLSGRQFNIWVLGAGMDDPFLATLAFGVIEEEA